MLTCLNCYYEMRNGEYCTNQNCLHPSFVCPVCKEVKNYINGSGDCTTCDTCCTCTEDVNGKTIYCHPY